MVILLQNGLSGISDEFDAMPNDADFDSKGNMYILDNSNSVVKVFAPNNSESKEQSEFESQGNTTITGIKGNETFLNLPSGITDVL